jgi:hypothetical protein
MVIRAAFEDQPPSLYDFKLSPAFLLLINPDHKTFFSFKFALSSYIYVFFLPKK